MRPSPRPPVIGAASLSLAVRQAEQRRTRAVAQVREVILGDSERLYRTRLRAVNT